ncbi:hypothetical protein ACNSOL_11820 (plasmid) [Aliarcobacter lanthieri]|uniref:hypothetical protein n=1 Tax=Aliarcobacter lanthieri TaxID=1355374 RepID=UPI003AAD32CD
MRKIFLLSIIATSFLFANEAVIVTFDKLWVGQNIVLKKDNLIYAGKAKNDIEQGRIFVEIEEFCDKSKEENICMLINGFVIDPDDDKVGLATIKAGKKVQLVIK